MGKQQSKDETIIVQNAAAGSNSSQLEEFKFHLSTTNILLAIIVLVICIVAINCVYRSYKRCHTDWMSAEFARNALRRSLYRPPQPQLPFTTADDVMPKAMFSTSKV